MIIALSGKNSHMMRKELRVLIDKAHKETGEFGVERIDASEVSADTILQAVQSVPFLATSKLVVVTNAQSNGALMDRVEEIVERTPDSVTVVLVGPVFDKRKASWKTLKKSTDVREYGELKPFELPKWVIKEAKSIGTSIGMADATYLVDIVGPDQLMLGSELKKMSIVTGAITRDTIDSLVEGSPQSTVFEMLDASFSGNSARALELYRQQRKQRVEPHYIIAMLSWQLHGLAMAVFANPQTESTLVSAGQSPYSARKALNLARSIDHADVKRYITDLVDLDRQIKTSSEPDAALELYLLGLHQAG